MTTPPYAELVAAVRREGEGILSAAELGLDAAVTTCGDWDVAALLRHVGGVFSYAAMVVNTRATSQPGVRVDLPEGNVIEAFGTTLDELIDALTSCDAETPVWNWATASPDVAAFWARRMAHEAAVHHFDAQQAHGVVQPIDPDLAADGIDELVDVLAPRIYQRGGIDNGPTGTVALDSVDDITWHLALHPCGVARIDPIADPDVTAHGTTSGLLLASYSRVPWTALEITGDADLLDRWMTALQF